MEAGKSIAEIFKIAANSKNKVLTLTFLRKGSQVLLGMKNRGFGQGKWNAFGGKIEAGETVREAAARECVEECGITVEKDKLEHTAVMLQRLPEFEELLEIHVFQTREFKGEFVESEEMTPKWFEESGIPYADMWCDDILWYPHMFQKQKFRAFVSFADHSTMVEKHIQLLNPKEEFF